MHVEGRYHLARHGRADPPHADDPQRLAPQVEVGQPTALRHDRQGNGVAEQLAALHGRMGAVNPAAQHEDKANRNLGHTLGVGRRGINDRDAQRAGRGDIYRIIANAVPPDHPQAGCRFEDRAGNFCIAHHQGIAVADGSQDPFCVLRVGKDQLACICQQGLSSRVDVFDHENFWHETSPIGYEWKRV